MVRLTKLGTVMHDSACILASLWQNCPNVLVQYFINVDNV